MLPSSILLALLATATAVSARPPFVLVHRQDTIDGSASPAQGSSAAAAEPITPSPSPSPTPNPDPAPSVQSSSSDAVLVPTPTTLPAPSTPTPSGPSWDDSKGYCADQCGDPGPENIPSICDELHRTDSCKKACADNSMLKCKRCIDGDPTVSAEYRAYLAELLAEWYFPYCTATSTKYGRRRDCVKAIEDLNPYKNCDSSDQCKPACTDSMISQLKNCAECIKADDTASVEEKGEVTTWETWMNLKCPQHRQCDKECETIGAELVNRCTDGNIACSSLCPSYAQAEACWNCQNQYNISSGIAPNGLMFYCLDGCGKTCAKVGNEFTKQCTTDLAACKGAMCTGENKANLDECNSCVLNSRLYTQQKATVQSALSDVLGICTGEPPKNRTGCLKECDGILSTYVDMCGGGNVPKCKGMCSAENRAALDACNLCAHGNESLYSDPIRASIQSNVTSIATWCQVAVEKPNDDPVVIGTLPKPRDLDKIVPKDEETNRKNPSISNPNNPNNPNSPIKNPFGNTSSSSSNNSSSNDSKGIPTWGIGVAAAGSVVAVLAAVSGVVAYNFECDHDHRKLRRKRKNKKKKHDDMPPPLMHPEPEKPQLVGYVYPTQTYTGVPTNPPMSPPPMPMGQYGHQGPHASYGAYAPYQPHQGGHQY